RVPVGVSGPADKALDEEGISVGSQALLKERSFLFNESFRRTLTAMEAARLEDIEQQLDSEDQRFAEKIEGEYHETRAGKLEQSLDRLEQYIRNLQSR